MYPVLSRKALSRLMCVGVAISFCVCWVVTRPDNITEWVRLFLGLPIFLGAIGYLFGATRVWRYVWRKVPQLSDLVFPDLNGVWKTEMQSNFPEMAKYHPELKGIDQSGIRSVTEGKFIIEQSFFAIRIRFDSDDLYTTSDTVYVRPSRDEKTGRRYLNYVYSASTDASKSTDGQQHFGAARLEINNDHDSMRGFYWTNRNASKGLNTAGPLMAFRQKKETKSS